MMEHQPDDRLEGSGALAWGASVAMSPLEIDDFLSGRWIARLGTRELHELLHALRRHRRVHRQDENALRNGAEQLKVAQQIVVELAVRQRRQGQRFGCHRRRGVIGASAKGRKVTIRDLAAKPAVNVRKRRGV